MLLYPERVLASLVPRHMAAGWHRRGEQYRNPSHQEQNHEVSYSHVHASARVMTGGVLDAARSGAPRDGLDCSKESTGVLRATSVHHSACVVDAVSICCSLCHIFLPGLCENHDFRTKNTLLILLGFPCAKDMCIIEA